MNAKERELQTVQLTYPRNGRLPLTVREMETGYTHANTGPVDEVSGLIGNATADILSHVCILCEEVDRLKRENAWLSAKLDTYERPHDLVRGN